MRFATLQELQRFVIIESCGFTPWILPRVRRRFFCSSCESCDINSNKVCNAMESEPYFNADASLPIACSAVVFPRAQCPFLPSNRRDQRWAHFQKIDLDLRSRSLKISRWPWYRAVLRAEVGGSHRVLKYKFSHIMKLLLMQLLAPPTLFWDIQPLDPHNH